MIADARHFALFSFSLDVDLILSTKAEQREIYIVILLFKGSHKEHDFTKTLYKDIWRMPFFSYSYERTRDNEHVTKWLCLYGFTLSTRYAQDLSTTIIALWSFFMLSNNKNVIRDKSRTRLWREVYNTMVQQSCHFLKSPWYTSIYIKPSIHILPSLDSHNIALTSILSNKKQPSAPIFSR